MVDPNITPPGSEKTSPPPLRKKGNSGKAPKPETPAEPEMTFDRSESCRMRRKRRRTLRRRKMRPILMMSSRPPSHPRMMKTSI